VLAVVVGAGRRSGRAARSVGRRRLAGVVGRRGRRWLAGGCGDTVLVAEPRIGGFCCFEPAVAVR